MTAPEGLTAHLDRLHTTELGAERIRRNLLLETDAVVSWCRKKIETPGAEILRKGKNWYIRTDGCVITVNAYSYTIITAHRDRGETHGKADGRNKTDHG